MDVPSKLVIRLIIRRISKMELVTNKEFIPA